MNSYFKIWELMNQIMPKDICRGYWQLEYLLKFIMDNPENINNLTKNVYPYVAKEFYCNPWCIEKNISRLIPLIDIEKLSKITGTNIDVESLTISKLIRIIVVYLKLNTFCG